MLYLIGLGLNPEGFSYEAFEAVKNCRKIYLENYTVELPYDKEEIEGLINKRVILADRSLVESNKIVNEAKEQNVALLVYGSPLMATTHITLIQEAKKNKIPIRVIQGASILDAVSETGLQLYKFGKITSIAKPQENFNSQSFISIVKENLSINAHSLILIDIGLPFKDALKQLQDAVKKEGVNLYSLVVCERLGLNNAKIYHNTPLRLKLLKIKSPFCFIIPAQKLHFLEEEVLKGFR
ncbi:diphthine synthase [Candidatus Pacearchaeota archaeon]|nr:diphthine synthase [Candidatus Pacearchaeota archaeon]